MNKVDNITAGSNIFIVDDDATNLNLLEKMLIASEYKVQSYLSGELALTACENNPPDMILLDINLPDMNGYEVCGSIKSNDKLKDIPVIFISGFSNAEEKVEAFRCGGVDYLTKPFFFDELRSRIKTHLEIKHNRQRVAMYVNQLQYTIDEMSTLVETGTLVANVVHDTKKFTSAMSMALESMIIPKLKEKLDESEDWVKEMLFDISEVHSNSNQCTEFLESLLSINRKNEELESVNIIKIIDQAINLVSYSMIQDGIRWEVNCDRENPLMVMGNGQLVRVFINLIVNAMEALKRHDISDPRITINVENIKEFIQVSVIDNGLGIKKDVLEGIRKGMVLSTKGKAGNGFGVSGLTKIVKSMNGSVDIESEVGNGAVFIVKLQRLGNDPLALLPLD